MGGWEEEAWYARLEEARGLKRLGDDGGFLRQAVAAFNQRPHRAESLYELARFYRERGLNDASLLFSEPGVAMPRPEGDILFLEDFVYKTGLQEEYSISANYARDPVRRDRGHAACNWLALNREIPIASRDLAWSNLFFYAEPARAMLPSFSSQPVGFTVPEGYHPSNPSVVRRGDEILLLQRAVNYTMREDDLTYQTRDGAPIRTRNFLLRLSPALAVESAVEILPPADMPPPAYEEVQGFEDIRPFLWRGALWGSACIRELTPEGWCEQVLARIDDSKADQCRLVDWRVLRPEGERLHEKNWMPQVAGDRLRFLSLCDPTRFVDEQARTVSSHLPAVHAKDFRGGSQLIAFDGGWLALIHEVHWRGSTDRRFYQHRFIWLDDAGVLRGVSRQFVLHAKGVEFAAGLAWHPDGRRLLISFGIADRESWIATVEADEVRRVLEDVTRLRSAKLGEDAGPPPDMRITMAMILHSEPSRGGADGAGGARPCGDGEGEEMLQPSGAAENPVRAMSPVALFPSLAPFLAVADSAVERRMQSRGFDARMANYLDTDGAAALPQIHCFYAVLNDKAGHHDLIAAMASMRAAGHPVRVWSYTPEKLIFLIPHGVELRQAQDVLSRGLFERIVSGSEVRYFSDIFRYAVLYEHDDPAAEHRQSRRPRRLALEELPPSLGLSLPAPRA
jgi:hypothetical protein